MFRKSMHAFSSSALYGYPNFSAANLATDVNKSIILKTDFQQSATVPHEYVDKYAL